MLRHLLIIILLGLVHSSYGQKVDSIFFNLYTDSLKRGTYNYINVEGRYDNGTYLPLGQKELKFSASEGRFFGNSLYVDSTIRADKIRVKAVLLSNPQMSKEVEIYIKKYESNERLPTMEEVLNSGSGTKDSTRKRKRKR